MPGTLEATRDYADAYSKVADAAMREHELAMLACEIQDVVELGNQVMRRWFRCSNQWHEWVSQSIEKYNAEQHRAIQSIEKQLIDTGNEVIESIEYVTDAEYVIDNEGEFRRLLEKLISQAEPISSEFQATTLRKHFDQARNEHSQGLTEPTKNPWS